MLGTCLADMAQCLTKATEEGKFYFSSQSESRVCYDRDVMAAGSSLEAEGDGHWLPLCICIRTPDHALMPQTRRVGLYTSFNII